MVGGGGFEPPKLSRQIYSLIPLAAREPLRKAAYFPERSAICQSFNGTNPRYLEVGEYFQVIHRSKALTDMPFSTHYPVGASPNVHPIPMLERWV